MVGWIADVKLGRSKVIKFSVWCCWYGTLIHIISLCIQYSTCGLLVSISKYGLSLIALLLLMVGTASYHTNILAYGLDQLQGYSSSHIRAFVHWIVWAQFVGFNVSFIAFAHNTSDSRLILLIGVIIFIAISIAVVLCSICESRFAQTGILVKNPYSLVYNVLKYAKQHKYPVNRSSFTYWENKTPSRIDFGKTSFGGPFSVDEVEAVKTFLKIVVVFLSSFGFYVPHYVLVNGALQFVNMFEGSQTAVNGYGSYILWNSFNKSILLIVPLLEIVVLPLYSKIEYFILSPLKCIAAAYVFVILTLISMLVLDIVGHVITDSSHMCFPSGDNALHISFYYYSIPFLFSGLAIVIAYISYLEFICSQAPVNMSGMLTGIFYLIRGIYTGVGHYIEVMLKNIDNIGAITCTFWILLIQIITCVIGFCIFLFVLKWYSQRRRSEEYYEAKAIEEKFDNYFQTELSELETKSDDVYIIYDD